MAHTVNLGEQFWRMVNSADGLPRWLSGKESTCQAEDMGLTPRWGRSPGEGNVNPLQYSCLGNPIDRRVWRATIHGVARESVGHDLRTKQQQSLMTSIWAALFSIRLKLEEKENGEMKNTEGTKYDWESSVAPLSSNWTWSHFYQDLLQWLWPLTCFPLTETCAMF